MKKVLLITIAFLTFGLMQAQDSGLRLGVHLGLPVGDASDFTSLAMGGDLAYLFDVSEGLKVGATAGYLHYSGKEFGGHKTNFGFVPIAATANYSIVENIFVGADLGYAIGVSPDGNDGGFYYLPKAGYQIDLFEVYLGYRGVSVDGGSINSISLGFNYNF